MQRAIGAMTRNSLDAGMRASTRALKQASAASLKQTKAAASRARKLAGEGAAGNLLAGSLLKDRANQRGLAGCVSGIAFAAAGARRYHLFKPPGMALFERLPLVVMLHGCGQDANAFALSTRMNRIAARERFLVLYPEQDRLANPQLCWNWYETRSRRAYGEAAIIRAAIDQVCLLYPVDPQRIGIAGLSAGAGMAALLATRYPDRFAAVVMHSGVPPGVADSTASAIRAMRGRAPAPAADPASPVAGATADWPPLLVIHGSLDRVVSASNAASAARLWAAAGGVVDETVRRVQRGARYPMTVTDFGLRNRPAATLCEIEGLGHAWSGGPATERFSDPRGPDASRLVWAFMSRRFRAAQPRPGQKALKRSG
jgi:poly(hydroxyalkanoate) depolymerase family esterase